MTSFFCFVNLRVIYRLGIISLAHVPVHVTDFPVVNVPVDELLSAQIWQDKLCATLSANVNINYRLPIKVQMTLVTSNLMGPWKKFESTVLRLKRSYENTGSVVCLTMKGWVLHWFDQHLCVRLSPQYLRPGSFTRHTCNSIIRRHSERHVGSQKISPFITTVN